MGPSWLWVLVPAWAVLMPRARPAAHSKWNGLMVADMVDRPDGERVGMALAGFNLALLNLGLQQLFVGIQQPESQARCAAAAHLRFSLDGVARYQAVYRSLDRA